MVRVDADGVGVDGRLLTIDGFSLKPDDARGLPVPRANFDGRRPTSPGRAGRDRRRDADRAGAVTGAPTPTSQPPVATVTPTLTDAMNKGQRARSSSPISIATCATSGCCFRSRRCWSASSRCRCCWRARRRPRCRRLEQRRCPRMHRQSRPPFSPRSRGSATTASGSSRSRRRTRSSSSSAADREVGGDHRAQGERGRGRRGRLVDLDQLDRRQYRRRRTTETIDTTTGTGPTPAPVEQTTTSELRRRQEAREPVLLPSASTSTVGPVGEGKVVEDVRSLEFLPSEKNPVVAFIGLGEGGERAVFSVTRRDRHAR